MRRKIGPFLKATFFSFNDKVPTFPHPRVEAIDGDVHVIALSKRPEPVQAPPLICVLQILQKGQVNVENHQLSPEKK